MIQAPGEDAPKSTEDRLVLIENYINKAQAALHDLDTVFTAFGLYDDERLSIAMDTERQRLKDALFCAVIEVWTIQQRTDVCVVVTDHRDEQAR